VKRESFEKCWAHLPLRVTCLHCHSPGVATVARRHCRTPSQLVVPSRYCNFSYFQDGHRRHLGFLKSRNFTGYSIWVARVETHQCAKFCQNRSIGRRYYDFSRWRPPPSWIFEIVNFYLLTVSWEPRRITVSKFVVPNCGDIAIFQDGRRRHPGFLKSRYFISYWISMPNFVKIGQWVAKILRIKIFQFFKMATAAILDLFGAYLDTNSEYLGVSITLQNLVTIDAVFISRLCASMSTTTTTRDRGDRYGPMEWAQ